MLTNGFSIHCQVSISRDKEQLVALSFHHQLPWQLDVYSGALQEMGWLTRKMTFSSSMQPSSGTLMIPCLGLQLKWKSARFGTPGAVIKRFFKVSCISKLLGPFGGVLQGFSFPSMVCLGKRCRYFKQVALFSQRISIRWSTVAPFGGGCPWFTIRWQPKQP